MTFKAESDLYLVSQIILKKSFTNHPFLIINGKSPFRNISIESPVSWFPEEILDCVVLLPQVLVERPDRLEVVPLDSVELEPKPGWILSLFKKF